MCEMPGSTMCCDVANDNASSKLQRYTCEGYGSASIVTVLVVYPCLRSSSGRLLHSQRFMGNGRPTLTILGCRSFYFQLFYAPWLAELFVLHDDVSLINMSLLYPNPPAPRNPEARSK